MRLLAPLLLAPCVFASLNAAPFVFSSTNMPPDLLVGFRKTGGAAELVVDLGSVSRFYSAAPGAVIPITEFSPALFSSTLGNPASVAFSVFAAVRVDGDPDRPLHSLWVSRKRTDPSVKSAPWKRQGSGSLGNTGSRISSIGSGAETFSSNNKPGPDNTPTAVVIPSANPSGYSSFLGSGNFKATFQGNAENVAPADFAEGSSPIRSDLYEIIPGSGDSKFLGYFDLTPAGVLTFTAAGGSLPPPAEPSIASISQQDSTSRVTLTSSETGVKYQLLAPPAGQLDAPFASWTPVSSQVLGTGQSITLTAESPTPTAFYRISASR
jgi:hypothetical protein